MKKISVLMVAIIVVAVLVGTFIMAKCATAEETGKDGRFIAYDNGTVLDTKTKLMWAASDNGSDIKWADAKSYCENYRGGGYTDWRMPSLDELKEMYITAQTDSKPGIRLKTNFVWASETKEFSSKGSWFSRSQRTTSAYCLNFSDGKECMYPLSLNVVGPGALPVRSGK